MGHSVRRRWRPPQRGLPAPAGVADGLDRLVG